MNVESVQFDFTPLGRNLKNKHRSAISGMTMTIYDSRFNLTTDVLQVLGNPEKISVSYNDQLESFLIFADENGMATDRKTNGGKTYRVGEVKTIMQNQNKCDFNTNFYRIQNGRKYGKYVLFSMSEIIEIKRGTRNGNN